MKVVLLVKNILTKNGKDGYNLFLLWGHLIQKIHNVSFLCESII